MGENQTTKSKVSFFIILPILSALFYVLYSMDTLLNFDSVNYLRIHKEIGAPDNEWQVLNSFFYLIALSTNVIFSIVFLMFRKKHMLTICFALLVVTSIFRFYGLEIADNVFRLPYSAELRHMTTNDLIEASLRDHPKKQSIYINRELNTRLDDMLQIASQQDVEADKAMVIFSVANAKRDMRFYPFAVAYTKKLMSARHPWYDKMLFLISRPANEKTLNALDDLSDFVSENSLPEEYEKNIKRWRSTVVNRMTIQRV